ncbi:MAG: SPFH domain-containing protein [Myxococcales bacterium]|jgi:membrane protease subunit (stomatin/prohibitin family)|nr:SPFH domain-containing protein [Myxococcales bacterium]
MADLRQEIRWGGTNEQIVWRSPITDFTSGSTVIVDASQVAVFYMNGQCSEVLEAGMHPLETCEIPFIKRIFQKVTGGKTSFKAELYYVNRVELPKLRWGVGPIKYEDPRGPHFDIGASGLYNIRISNPRKFVEQINGQDAWFDRDELEDRCCEFVAEIVENALVQAFYDNKISITAAARHKRTITQSLLPEIEAYFDRYGVSITQFIIERIAVPRDDPQYQRLEKLDADKGFQQEELNLKANEELANAQIEAQKRDILSGAAARQRQREGYTYQDERRFDVLESTAQSSSSGGGGFGGGGLGGQVMQLGVGLGAAGAIGGMVRENLGGVGGFFGNQPPPPVAAPAGEKAGAPCVKCGAMLKEGAKFCLECGEKVAPKPGTACAKCGNALPPNAKFCLECGEKVIPPGHVVCPGCAKVVAQGKFCLECGHSFVPPKVTCACGYTFENEGKFCPECGQTRPAS